MFAFAISTRAGEKPAEPPSAQPAGGLTLVQTVTEVTPSAPDPANPDAPTSGTRQYEQTLLISGTKARQDITGGGSTIIRLDKELTWTIRPPDPRNKDKVANEMTFAQLAEDKDRKKGVIRQFREMYKDRGNKFDEYLREQMRTCGVTPEEVLGEKREITVRETGETREIAGRKCVKFEAVEKGKVTATAWVAGDLKVSKDFLRFLELVKLVDAPLREALEKHEGMPLELTIDRPDGSRTRIVSTRVDDRTAVPASTFELPEGYRAVKTEMK
jgi:hypothetical protein